MMNYLHPLPYHLHRQNNAGESVLYRYFHGKYSDELNHLIPVILLIKEIHLINVYLERLLGLVYAERY